MLSWEITTKNSRLESSCTYLPLQFGVLPTIVNEKKFMLLKKLVFTLCINGPGLYPILEKCFLANCTMSAVCASRLLTK